MHPTHRPREPTGENAIRFRIGWLFVVTLVLCLFNAPLAAEAQSAGKVPRVGVLMQTAPPPAPDPFLAAFRQGLRELGYVEGQNVASRSAGQKECPVAWPRSCRSWSAFPST